MIRKFNYTGRKTIPVAGIDVELGRDADGTPRFSCEVHLEESDLPPDARVYVEAYARYGFQRFPAGTVSKPERLRDHELRAFNASDLIRFRLKVIDESGDHGRLLGLADAITPREPGSTDGRRLSLLPVEPLDLGQRIWKAEIRPDGPVLVVNSRISDIYQRVASDPGFQCLVLPEVLREVLSAIVLEGETWDPWSEDDWQGRWLRFAMRFHPETPPEGDDDARSEKEEWVDAVVAGFCDWQTSANRYAAISIAGDTEP